MSNTLSAVATADGIQLFDGMSAEGKLIHSTAEGVSQLQVVKWGSEVAVLVVVYETGSCEIM